MNRMSVMSAVVCMVFAGCARWEASGQADEFLESHRGKVLVLLLGREDCPGTIKATAVLDEYAAERPEGVELMRLDVPLPGEQLKVEAWKHSWPRKVDQDRRVAQRLEFFYYPTLYVLDREGSLRFSGGCDGSRVRVMVKEILAERPGQAKKSYNLPMPAVGEMAPAFSSSLVQGGATTLDSLRGPRGTLLVFARTSCPFTIEVLPSVKEMAENYREKGMAVVVVNGGEELKSLRAIYEKHAPGVPVVWDKDGRISAAYGVDVTPFLFLLDKDGKIVQHRSYTPEAAAGGIKELLGIEVEAPRYNPTGAG